MFTTIDGRYINWRYKKTYLKSWDSVSHPRNHRRRNTPTFSYSCCHHYTGKFDLTPFLYHRRSHTLVFARHRTNRPPLVLNTTNSLGTLAVFARFFFTWCSFWIWIWNVRAQRARRVSAATDLGREWRRGRHVPRFMSDDMTCMWLIWLSELPLLGACVVFS